MVIGASLGGPPALQKVLSGLPDDFPAPVAVVQHIAAGMTGVLAEQLDRTSGLQVAIAEHGERLSPGRAYVAPIGKHLRFKRDGRSAKLTLDQDFADSLHVPSVDVAMSSAAMTFGSCALAVLLTGMGSDGALGMHAVHRAGGHTIAESEDTAVSFGMPGSAIALGAAAVSVPLDVVADAVVRRVRASV